MTDPQQQPPQPPSRPIHYGVTAPAPKVTSTTGYGWQWAITIIIVVAAVVILFAIAWPKST